MNKDRGCMVSWVCVGLLSLGGFSTTALGADQYKMDPSHTAVVFRIGHLNMSHTFGRFNAITGAFSFNAQDAGASSISLSIKTKSIDTGFEKRDDHLRSPDFFNAKQFPVITFQSKKVEATAEGYRVTGDLALHGVTQSIVVDLKKMGEGKDPWGNYRQGYGTELSLKRSDFGMTNMLEAVGDQVDLMISFEGLRQ